MSGRTPLTVSARKASSGRLSYLGLFTVDSWREFLADGGSVIGFNAGKAGTVSKLAPGDRILCYLTKVSAFAGALEVTGPHFFDERPIWTDGVFPLRLPVKVLHSLPLSHAVQIRALRGKLSFLPTDHDGPGWTAHVRSSPRRWQSGDAAAVMRAIRAMAKRAPLPRRMPQVSEARGDGERPVLRVPPTMRVGRLISKSVRIRDAEAPELLGSYESALSFNKVTGYSVNFPIAATCQPTATCMKTCYFATGAPSWSNSLRHQYRVFATATADPIAFAERVALEYDRLGLTFLRWNGGGDLFAASVAAVNHLGKVRPDMTIWVVSRIPEFAAKIDHAPRVFVHFSLDRHSRGRAAEFLRLRPKSGNYFFSYQCDKGERPATESLAEVSVLFFDGYEPTMPLRGLPRDIICPLNEAADIAGVCERCRRCFSARRSVRKAASRPTKDKGPTP